MTSFEIDQDIEDHINHQSPHTSFKELLLSHYENDELKDLWDFISKSTFSHHIFYKAVFHEHGCFPLNSPNLDKAFELYKEAAQLRDSFANFRLHYIYKNEYESFKVEKDRYQEMLYLIKAAAYFDEKDNRINRKYIDPVMHLAVHLDNEDPDLIKTVELLEKFKEEGEEELRIGQFLHNWCCVRFILSDSIRLECLKNLVNLADENDTEACYFLGESYRYGQEFRQDLETSKKYLQIAKQDGCIKAIESLGYIY